MYFHNKMPRFFVLDIETPLKASQPMEQALPLPYFQPSTAVLAKIRQFARTFRPQPYVCLFTM